MSLFGESAPCPSCGKKVRKQKDPSLFLCTHCGQPGPFATPEQVAFLTFGRGLDTTRMRSMLGFEPSFSTAEAFADFAASLGPGVFGPERVLATESALMGALTSGGGSRG